MKQLCKLTAWSEVRGVGAAGGGVPPEAGEPPRGPAPAGRPRDEDGPARPQANATRR